MATPKQAHALVSYFIKVYEGRYATKPKVNRYKARYGMDAVLMELSEDEAKGLIDYYFETISTNGHALEWFFYNYDKLQEAMEKSRADAAALAVIREQSKRRAEEWRKRIGND